MTQSKPAAADVCSLAILGATRVGKTTICNSFSFEAFYEICFDYGGDDIHRKSCLIDGIPIIVETVDFGRATSPVSVMHSITMFFSS